MNIGVGEALLIALCGFVTVFLLLIFLIVVIKIISAVVVSLQKGKNKAAVPAACIMAIISDETDIPLDELQFRRIQAL